MFPIGELGQHRTAFHLWHHNGPLCVFKWALKCQSYHSDPTVARSSKEQKHVIYRWRKVLTFSSVWCNLWNKFVLLTNQRCEAEKCTITWKLMKQSSRVTVPITLHPSILYTLSSFNKRFSCRRTNTGTRVTVYILGLENKNKY